MRIAGVGSGKNCGQTAAKLPRHLHPAKHKTPAASSESDDGCHPWTACLSRYALAGG